MGIQPGLVICFTLDNIDAWDKGLVHWEDSEESGREGGGRGDQEGEYM